MLSVTSVVNKNFETEPTIIENTRAATIYDVANAAGVSHQTVSRYLKGYAGIRAETRARVEDALGRLDYRPNLAARSLKSGRSHRIGALTHDLSQVGPSRIAQGASAGAREAGYVLDLVAVDARDTRAIEASIDVVTQHTLAGIIALSSTDEMTRTFEAARFRVPFVLHTALRGALRAAPDRAESGIAALMAHLVELGHRRILEISGPPAWAASRDRSSTIDAALAQHGLVSVARLAGDWSAASGHEVISRLPSLDGATAIIASNDQMALGAMLALKSRGLSVPDDVSITGIDDVPEAAFFDPPLTTLRLDFEAEGRQAVAELLQHIEGSEIPWPIANPPQLVVRSSTGPAPH